MDAEQQKRLRAPFEGAQIGQLPRVTCGDCSKKSCQKHQRQQCRTCGAYVSTQHIHLSYVGHAAVTDRLLEVDPGWTWEPVAFDEQGLPRLDRNGGLWIRLTVAGVTRLGYGDASGKQGADAVKEAVGDSIRNSAMRFGVALDLWHKGDLHAGDDAPTPPAAPPRQRTNGQQQPAAPPAATPEPPTADEARALLKAACADNKWDLGIVATRFKAVGNGDLKTTDDAAAIVKFRDGLFSVSDSELRKQPAANGATR